jgi:hypothetical protein
MSKIKNEQLLHTCAWCNQEITEDEDLFGFGANASHGVNLEGKEGEFVSLNLALRDKTVFALVPEKHGDSNLAGYNLLFITCSEDCAQTLKNELDLERDVFEEG